MSKQPSKKDKILSKKEASSTSEEECRTNKHHHDRKRHCFGVCCSQSALAYGKFYRSLGTRSLEALDVIKENIDAPLIETTFLSLQATVFGGLDDYPSIHPAVRSALAAVAQSCGKNCCCEVADSIIETALGYIDLAISLLLSTAGVSPDAASYAVRVGLVTNTSTFSLGILPPELALAKQDVPDVVYFVSSASIGSASPGFSELGNLIESFINTLRVALDSFCPAALKLYDSWDTFSVPVGLPVPPVKNKKVKIPLLAL